ncbi:AgmX/PglI C-terminal domain-containing protein [Bradymonas sediminis]|uniref:Uncharacterized protein n=1 Tax=Bradymonas sediminis TaxID=1548548 RepID=A0A2Z4FN36_9DELT|nr:AgmX/PglI C-terminal domain-containing protein [Bradymonas sediminis]AWV90342.1 hypothetical protein DN745_13785 [Bradymonas sediminis]TDP75681.1 FHA domain protein [Bradymonas sediminis]
MSQNSRRLRFEIVQNGEVIRTEELDQDVIKVGKLASSHLRLDDPNVSRIHAVIEKGSGGAYSVIDLGSASGSFLNGEKITKDELKSGDELTFGDTVVRVEFVDATAQAAAPAASATVNAGVTQQAQAEVAPEPTGPTMVTLEDGSVVEAFAQQGYYDENSNYIPFWYDESGQSNPGYGYYDEQGAWQVVYGYYDPEGEWIATESPIGFGGGAPSEPAYARTPDSEIYQDEFFESSGGDTLEVAMLWSDHVLSVNSYNTARTVSIGPDTKNDFIVHEEGIAQSESFPLVSYEANSYAVVFLPGMNGVIRDQDTQYTLEEAVAQNIARPSSTVSGAFEVRLGARTSARVDVGETTFLIHFTDMPAVIGGGFAIDTAPLPYLAVSAVAHILFILLVLNVPSSADSLDLDGFSAQDRFVEMLMKPEQEEEVEPDWLGAGDDNEEAAKHKGDEGQAGEEDAPDEDNRMAVKGPPDNTDMEIKKAEDTNIAMNAGVMKVFNDNQISSMWGSGESSIGSDAVHAIGSLDKGAEFGASKGFGGLGVRGAGRGGGGVSESGIGMANVGTAGRGGGGGGGGTGYGKGASNLGEKDDKLPTIVPGKPQITGSLDKEIIRRVVRKHRRELTNCYQMELQKNKNLAGQVKVKFTIAGSGSVIAAVVSSSTMKNRTVESCITGKIQRWIFPEPKGGGIVVVNYPFNFSKQ